MIITSYDVTVTEEGETLSLVLDRPYSRYEYVNFSGAEKKKKRNGEPGKVL